ncbi:hypothetical protein OG887_04005 [Streptomyces sp. NBC_00053]|uniref:hypothetical protein n=1 Tax=unclassified Streptomyces TaxID=2593676 RepID=UPI001F14EF2B|nr:MULTISPECIES: hypothetical protein [unclassified Streptomyces]WSW99658.1 hypothetical protein OG355_04065 [Streptomyces sp. NBC_00987]MCX4398580.1 hypothetical protein [Streptomyces sp. NBC_01767]MCX5098715.1 hypothetical protein [Streptomyces sp. NBC_00439]MCX5158253.1 hypothetical protein [Streptomyces sp. NBC_00305]MCX5216776.1 hypothetical protein [Streptomyces sp. NBC_00264]
MESARRTGPGTGQLTVPLASAGCQVTAVEPGLSPAAVTTHRVAGGSEEFFDR